MYACFTDRAGIWPILEQPMLQTGGDRETFRLAWRVVNENKIYESEDIRFMHKEARAVRAYCAGRANQVYVDDPDNAFSPIDHDLVCYGFDPTQSVLKGDMRKVEKKQVIKAWVLMVLWRNEIHEAGRVTIYGNPRNRWHCVTRWHDPQNLHCWAGYGWSDGGGDIASEAAFAAMECCGFKYSRLWAGYGENDMKRAMCATATALGWGIAPELVKFTYIS